MIAQYTALIAQLALVHGIPANVIKAVIMTESGGRAHVVSPTNDYGLMQLNAAAYPTYTARQLLDPITNLRLGTAHLAMVKQRCIHQKELEWLTCYNLGIEGAKKVKHPSKWPYVRKIKERI